ncbi:MULTISPECIES: hypothetical protein [Microbacterium]|jgi:hypothetical protein|uniref:hypothetical protein n=1 Tax=Microbacterium TaxID=33882 RepID=UPI0007B29E9A|nr:hypothetical protein [Microbacterium sp. TNHR37B]KZE90490.1 hypothetical protein AVP41_00009 [Microbacterium sp. TNHR37B]
MNATEHMEARRRAEEEPERARISSHETATAEASELARHRDPSLTDKDVAAAAAKKKARGVEWVRPSDLLVSRSARLAGRGIDFQAELSRRARRLPGQTYRATRTGMRTMSERARRLPPATAFGRGSGERYSWVSRSGIGLG